MDAAFDLIKAGIDAFGDGEAAIPQATEAVIRPSSNLTSDQAPAAVAEAVEAASVADRSEAEIEPPAEAVTDAPAEADAETLEVAEVAAGASEVAAEAADVTVESAEMKLEAAAMAVEAASETAGAAEAYDEDLLERIALEMAAPDPADVDDAMAVVADELDATPEAEPVIVAETPEPVAATASAQVQVPLQPPLEPPVEPSLQPSLGSSLIASGILRKPAASTSDPLAAIRRLSQAEKIALFS